MSPVPKDYPLESFDPRFAEILRRGAKGEDFTIQCQSANEAIRMQHMLHSYRARAKAYYADDESKWRPLYLAIISRIRDEHGRKTILHVRSRHDEFSTTLDNVMPLPEPDDTDRSDPLDEFTPHNHNAKPEGSGG